MSDTISPNTPLTWVIADIHGCDEAFMGLEARIADISSQLGRSAMLVSVGDLIDRGPGSCQVVQRFIDGGKAGTHCAVMGNHEMELLAAIYRERPEMFGAAGIQPPYWLQDINQFLADRPGFQRIGSRTHWNVYYRLFWTSQGGAETLESYGCDPMRPSTWALPHEHLRYLSQLPFYWEDDLCVVTHALTHRQDLVQLRAGKQLDPEGIERTVWNRKHPPEAPDPDRIHVSGHTPMPRVRRIKPLSLVRLDLGAYAGDRLAAWSPQLDRTVTVCSDVIWQRGQL